MANVGVHNNVHVPKESWPHWIWLVIEFFIVLAIANVIAYQTSPAFEDMVVTKNLECEQVSHESECSFAEEASSDEKMLIWIYWSIVGAVFIGWYIIIRGIILKKPILENR